jgi:thiol-disulfide isomerase/thioredoxin
MRLGGGIAVIIIAMMFFSLKGGGVAGGGNFDLTAYQGSSSLGGTNVDFDQVRRAAAGKPIVLNFLGGSCPPCRAEMPGFQRVHDRLGDDYLMLGLDVGPFFGLGTRNAAFQLLDELHITYPIAAANDRAPIQQYGATALPATFFFDGDGNLVDQRLGFMNEQDFQEALLKLIEQTTASAGDDQDA